MTAQNRHLPSRRASLLAGLVVLALLGGLIAALLASAGPSLADPSAKASSPAPRARAASSRGDRSLAPALDVYGGPAAVSAVRAANHKLHGAVSGAYDYLPDGSWRALSDSEWLLDAWAFAKVPLTLAVPMLPASGASLASGAEGEYNRHFVQLAKRLVADHLGKTTLVVGWEPEIAGHSWSVANGREAREYVRYWHHIYSAMTRVKGAHFRFVWDIGDSTSAHVKPPATYPGNRFVDVIATAAFDAGFTNVPAAWQWNTTLDEGYGAAWASSFARSKHKQLAVIMLGVSTVASGGGGNRGAYVSSALRWADRAHAVSVTLWDPRSSGALGGKFPAAARAITAAVRHGEVRCGIAAKRSRDARQISCAQLDNDLGCVRRRAPKCSTSWSHRT